MLSVLTNSAGERKKERRLSVWQVVR